MKYSPFRLGICSSREQKIEVAAPSLEFFVSSLNTGEKALNIIDKSELFFLNSRKISVWTTPGWREAVVMPLSLNRLANSLVNKTLASLACAYDPKVLFSWDLNEFQLILPSYNIIIFLNVLFCTKSNWL